VGVIAGLGDGVGEGTEVKRVVGVLAVLPRRRRRRRGCLRRHRRLKNWTISGFGVSWTRRFDHWFVSHTTRRIGYGEREGFGTIFRRVTVRFLLGRGIKAALGDADTTIIIRGGGGVIQSVVVWADEIVDTNRK
jgi:hypothetical protein